MLFLPVRASSAARRGGDPNRGGTDAIIPDFSSPSKACASVFLELLLLPEHLHQRLERSHRLDVQLPAPRLRELEIRLQRDACVAAQLRDLQVAADEPEVNRPDDGQDFLALLDVLHLQKHVVVGRVDLETDGGVLTDERTGDVPHLHAARDATVEPTQIDARVAEDGDAAVELAHAIKLVHDAKPVNDGALQRGEVLAVARRNFDDRQPRARVVNLLPAGARV
mmetsp:Transcript_11618/g.36091  ORF Transcript_11618/g.36091 Transcript_11618/m.36091 type:complete len:224 (+) Transcript_11618:69-740(+)